MIRSVTVLLALVAAAPAAADMGISFQNTSPLVIEWMASPSTVPHTLGSGQNAILPLTPDPVTVRISQSAETVCEGTATFRRLTGMPGSPGSCEISVVHAAGRTGNAASLMCVAFMEHPGGPNCTAGVRVVPAR